jgi:hypothetical protein
VRYRKPLAEISAEKIGEKEEARFNVAHIPDVVFHKA